MGRADCMLLAEAKFYAFSNGDKRRQIAKEMDSVGGCIGATPYGSESILLLQDHLEGSELAAEAWSILTFVRP